MVRNISMKRKHMNRRTKSKRGFRKTTKLMRKSRSRGRKVGGGGKCSGRMADCPTKPELSFDEGVWKEIKGQDVTIIDSFTSDGFKMLIELGVKDHSFTEGEHTLVMWFESIKDPDNLDKLRNLIIETTNCPNYEDNVSVSPLLYLLIISSSSKGGSNIYSKSIIWLIDHFNLMLPPGWQQFQDRESSRFYYQSPIGKVDWKRPTTCYPELYFIAVMIKHGVTSYGKIGYYHMSSFMQILIMLLSCNADLLEEYNVSPPGEPRIVLQDVSEAIHNFYEHKEQGHTTASYYFTKYKHWIIFSTILRKITELHKVVITEKMWSVDKARSFITATDINRQSKETLTTIKTDEEAERRQLEIRKSILKKEEAEESLHKEFRNTHHGKPVLTLPPELGVILKDQYKTVVRDCQRIPGPPGPPGLNLLECLNKIYKGGGIAQVETVDKDNRFLYNIRDRMCEEKSSGRYRYLFLINDSNSNLTTLSQNMPIMLLPPPPPGEEIELLGILPSFQFFSDAKLPTRQSESDEYYKRYAYHPVGQPINPFYIFLYKCK